MLESACMFSSDYNLSSQYNSDVSIRSSYSDTLNHQVNVSKIVELRSVYKKYGKGNKEVVVLRDVNLDIFAGEIVALVGPSGSGKSTLLNLIGGLDKPDVGEVIVDGRNLSRLNDRELSIFRNRTIGFVFQFFYLQPYLTTQENVEIPLMFRGERRDRRSEKARQVLKHVGLSDRMTHLPSQLSGGQMQRVAIARAIVNDPKIILADEPTGNLDTKTGAEIINLLHNINKSLRTTIVIVTHDPNVAGQAHRIIEISDGRVV
ncbi:MAG: macrolide ABC transporter ATP-binding protein [Candidatus Dojkabacteria bacterium]|nr:MAG: macrolide ABC transporter ATP-binding protein [Candidatus Dojkabacteria bacterium]